MFFTVIADVMKITWKLPEIIQLTLVNDVITMYTCNQRHNFSFYFCIQNLLTNLACKV